MRRDGKLTPGLLDRLHRDRDGNVTIIIALVLMTLLTASGVALDGIRAYALRSELSRAVDAAALAGGRSLHEDDRDATVRNVFAANFPANSFDAAVGAPEILPDTEAQTLKVSVTASMPTTLMRLIGKESIDVYASSTTQSESAKGMELALVLDTTGSMSGSKLTALKAAANDLIEVIYGNRETVQNVWVSVVPFAGRVNIKPWKSWIKDSSNLFLTYLWGGCPDVRSGALATDDTPPSGGKWKIFAPHGNWYDAADYCTRTSILPLTAEKSSITAKITALEAHGNTRTDIGLAWGWRNLSPRWRGLWSDTATLPLDYETDHMSKVVILMTDGENTPWQSGDSLTEQQTNQNLAAECTAMKNAGIEIYTITFQAPSYLDPIYSACASSVEHHFINAPTEAALEEAFGRIGGQLLNRNLRIVR